MENEKKTILICGGDHRQSYPTPLISTMAFRHCELWCPYCGYKLGMFDGGVDVPWTQELQDRHNKYEARYSDYLHSWAVTYASGTQWEGKTIDPINLPDTEKARLREVRKNGWKERIKIEE